MTYMPLPRRRVSTPITIASARLAAVYAWVCADVAFASSLSASPALGLIVVKQVLGGYR